MHFCRLWLIFAAAVLVSLTVGCTSDTTESPVAERTVEAVTLPVKVPYGDLAGQYGWLDLPSLEPPAKGYPVVILVHGGFWSEPWDYTLMSPLATDLVGRGYATWNIEFRRLGGFGGFPETFDDVGAAVDLLGEMAGGQSHGAAGIYPQPDLDLSRIILIGHSSGGHLALWALGRDNALVQPVAAVGLGAITDLDVFPQSQTLLGGDRSAFPQRYAFAAPELDPERVVLIHGSGDSIVPRSSLAQAESLGTPIVEIDGNDHFDLIDPTSTAWAAAIQAITEAIG